MGFEMKEVIYMPWPVYVAYVIKFANAPAGFENRLTNLQIELLCIIAS